MVYIIIIFLLIIFYIYSNFSILNKTCVVFVCNKKYFNKFLETCNKLITNGKYKGDICLIIGDDLNNDPLLNNNLIKENNIIIKYFPDIKFSDNFYNINNNINTDNRNIKKKFQWHKLHLFNTFFKKWNFILYIDCGMHIYSNIQQIINLKKKNKLLAHSDAYPDYKRKLYDQFDKNSNYFTELNSKYNLNIDYFQTTMMLYDTNIIKSNTFNNLLNLSNKYPISNTNEQGIISLYFTNIKPLWEQIKTHDKSIYFYDFLIRDKNFNYIMIKYPDINN